MATYTPNYGLHQWVPEDTFLRTDFNEDLGKIDTALKTAQDTADSASSIASSALSKADHAQASADNAQSTANSALEKANHAQSSADSAQSTANSALQNSNGRAKVVSGTYSGRGTYGASGGASITFPFVPKMVFIRPNTVNYSGPIFQLMIFSGTNLVYSDHTNYPVHLVWSGTNLSFYGDSNTYLNNAMNVSGCTYSYLAIA